MKTNNEIRYKQVEDSMEFLTEIIDKWMYLSHHLKFFEYKFIEIFNIFFSMYIIIQIRTIKIGTLL